MQVKILAEGGNMKPSPALSQKLGPAGININQVIKQVNEATQDFKGLKVPVELEIDSEKNIEVNVFSPPVSELLKKELGLEKGSGEASKTKVADISIEQIISIAKQKLPNLLAKDLKAAVKTVVGTCNALGVLVEDKPANEVQEDIDKGKFDKAIKEERTEMTEEKKHELEEHMQEVEEEQEKEAEEEKAQEEAEQPDTGEQPGENSENAEDSSENKSE